MSNVHLTSTAWRKKPSASSHLLRPLNLLKSSAVFSRKHNLVDDPEVADVVVFVESHADDSACGPYFGRLRADPVYRQFRRKCVLLTGLDTVVPLVPGIFPSIPARRRWRAIARSGPYLVDTNPYITQHPSFEASSARWLASFVGCVRSIPVRQSLARLCDDRILVQDNSEAFIKAVQSNPVEEQRMKMDYVKMSYESSFILCPRGYGASSIRLFEAMEMGRCPVIISDDWEPPAGINWERCTIRVLERDVARLPKILREHESVAMELGMAARKNWEDNFSPNAIFDWTIAQAMDLLAVNPWSRRIAKSMAWCQLVLPPHLRRLFRNAKNTLLNNADK